MEPSLTQTHRILAANYNLLTRHVEGVLRDIWDPIWLGIGGPVDEYDRYAPGIVALVRDTTVFENTIIGHLTRIEAAEMCLPASHERTLRAARALLGLREACARAPDMLVTQAVSEDGLRCLWVFQRPDNLFIYEHATLCHEEDENGNYAWWTIAGEGRSGLYSAAESAAEDARTAIDWRIPPAWTALF
jgi:hypothetical protein